MRVSGRRSDLHEVMCKVVQRPKRLRAAVLTLSEAETLPFTPLADAEDWRRERQQRLCKRGGGASVTQQRPEPRAQKREVTRSGYMGAD